MSHRRRIKLVEEVLTPPPAEAELEPFDYFAAIAPLAPTPESIAYWEAAARGEEVGPPPMAELPFKVGRP